MTINRRLTSLLVCGVVMPVVIGVVELLPYSVVVACCSSGLMASRWNVSSSIMLTCEPVSMFMSTCDP